MGPQAQHLIEGEPFGTACGLRCALGQVSIVAQHATKMGLGDGDQIFGDLPCREEAQALLTGLIHSSSSKILTPSRAGLSDYMKVLRRRRWTQIGHGLIGINIEVRGEGLTHREFAYVLRSQLCIIKPVTWK